MTVPIAVLAPAAPALIHAAEHDPVHIITAVLYLGLGPTALGYTCWSYALGHGSAAARSASLLYAVPVVTINLDDFIRFGQHVTLVGLDADPA